MYACTYMHKWLYFWKPSEIYACTYVCSDIWKIHNSILILSCIQLAIAYLNVSTLVHISNSNMLTVIDAKANRPTLYIFSNPITQGCSILTTMRMAFKCIKITEITYVVAFGHVIYMHTSSVWVLVDVVSLCFNFLNFFTRYWRSLICFCSCSTLILESFLLTSSRNWFIVTFKSYPIIKLLVCMHTYIL